MKKEIPLWIGLLLHIAMIAGCTGSGEKTGTSPYQEMRGTLTATIPNLKTTTPTLTLTPTNTSTPVITPSAIPTLSMEDASNRLLDLLSNNSGCRLPCLWGITPGTSTSLEAQAILSPLNSIRNKYSLPGRFSSEKGFAHPIYAEDNLMLDVRAEYLSNAPVVNNIHFYAREFQLAKAPNGETGLFDVFDSETFGKRVNYYSLSHVLSEQGIPETVMIATSDSPSISVPSIGYFYIVLLYPDQGLWVKYTMQMDMADTIVRGCPINAHIEMELYPSGNADLFSASLKQKQDWVIQKDWFQPLEEVTTMSVKQFHETFRQPTDNCIETPAKLWTLPKP